MPNPLHSLRLRYRLTMPLLSRFPRGMRYRLATAHAQLLSHAHANETAAIRQQMRRVFTDVPDRTLTDWSNYYFGLVDREALDSYVFPRLKGRRQVDRFIRMKGFSQLKQARQSGRRVMITGGHLGRFWMAGIGMNEHGVKVGTLTRDGDEANVHGLPPEEHRYRLLKLRHLQQRLGGPFLVSGENLRPIYRALDESVMAMLIDVPYDRAHPGLVPVPFLGKTGYFAGGIARVAKKTRALIFPYFVNETSTGLEAEFLGPMEASDWSEQAIMEHLVDELEARIRRQPGSWWLWPALPLIWKEQ